VAIASRGAGNCCTSQNCSTWNNFGTRREGEGCARWSVSAITIVPRGTIVLVSTGVGGNLRSILIDRAMWRRRDARGRWARHSQVCAIFCRPLWIIANLGGGVGTPLCPRRADANHPHRSSFDCAPIVGIVLQGMTDELQRMVGCPILALLGWESTNPALVILSEAQRSRRTCGCLWSCLFQTEGAGAFMPLNSGLQ
jgi:hypothetical protein